MTNRFLVQAKAARKAELLIYGDIGESWYEDESNDAKSVVSTLQNLRDHAIDVRINSYGGSVADGLAIYNALRRHPSDVEVFIDGVAYSIASLIAMGGNSISMPENGLLMIHAPWGMAAGNAADMREMAGVLDKYAAAMESAYIRDGGPSIDMIRSWLGDGKDHYFSAQEANEIGLIDVVIPSRMDVAASLPYLERFKNPAEFTAQKREAVMALPEDTAPAVKSPDDPKTIVRNYGAARDQGIAEGARAEKKRQSEIRALFGRRAFQRPEVQAVLQSCLDDEKVDKAMALDRAVEAVEALPENAPINTAAPLAGDGGAFQYGQTPFNSPIGGHRQSVSGGADRSGDGIRAALEIRAGLVKDRETIQKERNNEFLAMSMVELMARELRAAGHRIGGTRESIANAYARHAMVQAAGPSTGTGHLTGILADVANKSVMAGWDEANETWGEWTATGTLNDYRSAQRANLALTQKLNLMLENEEWEYGKLRDVKQSITGYFYGIKDSLSIQAIVNDDLNELTRALNARGEAASATVGDAVFALLTTAGTGGFGQTMDEDSQIVFHADHSNYIASGSGGAPASATISAGMVAMGTQTDQNSRTIGVQPRYILHGQTLRPTVAPLLSSASLITGADGTLPEGNWVAGLGLSSVIDYRWDGWTTASAWVLAAARRTVEVAGVAGPLSPRTEQAMVSDIPGITYETSMPFGAAVLDYRGLYLNYGS